MHVKESDLCYSDVCNKLTIYKTPKKRPAVHFSIPPAPSRRTRKIVIHFYIRMVYLPTESQSWSKHFNQ